MRDLLAGVLAGAAPVRIERAHAQARVGLHRVEDALTQLERQGLGDSVRAREVRTLRGRLRREVRQKGRRVRRPVRAVATECIHEIEQSAGRYEFEVGND